MAKKVKKIVLGPTEKNFFGSVADEIIVGNKLKNKIDGGGGDDIITGGEGNDKLVGGSGDDIVKAGVGNDKVNGGIGTDMLALKGNLQDAIITERLDGSLTIKLGGAITTAKSIEFFKFSDGIVSAADLVNDAPSGTSTAVIAGTEDTPLIVSSAQLLQGFTDVNTGDTLSVVGLTADHGTVINNGNGSFTITPDLNFNGTLTISYEVSDGDKSIAATNTVTIVPEEPSGEVDLSKAIDIGELVSPYQFDQTLAIGTTILKFTISSPGSVDLSSVISGDFTATLVQDLNGDNQISEDERFNTATFTTSDSGVLSTLLDSGTYYIVLDNVTEDQDVQLALASLATGPIPEEELFVIVEATVGGVNSTTLNPIASSLTFATTGSLFPTDLSDIRLTLNGAIYAGNALPGGATLSVSPDGTTLTLNDYYFESGLNSVALSAPTSDGSIVADTSFWAGDETLSVTVIGTDGLPAANQLVTLTILTQADVVLSATTDSNGLVTFVNVPNTNMILKAQGSDGVFGSLGVIGDEGEVSLSMTAIGEVSDIDNNDFSSGTDGWIFDPDTVTIVPHDGEAASQSKMAPNVAAVDNDVLLTTTGEGPQTLQRTFDPVSEAGFVTIRYRFITSEVPGGYFGSQYNDYYSITLRTSSGAVDSDSQSMNGLGLGAFSANGETDWRELTVKLNAGDTVNVSATVANVADGALDSQLQIDLVKESKFQIDALSLKDIDNSQLEYLSVDSENPYFSGNTRVHGTITLSGEEKTKLSDIVLEIVQNGVVAATATLTSAVKAALTGIEFGADKKISISGSQLMFELSNAQAAGVDVSKDGSVLLRVKATATDGTEATKDFGSVDILTHVEDATRYGGRDVTRGGDDWVRPNLIPFIDHFDTLMFGDFSNMNGGSFAPDHALHRDGISIDAWFDGYNARNAATAAKMIALLNDDTYGSDIQTVFVTFERKETDPFYSAINGVTLDDGRLATDVIRVEAGHTTHFHWEVAV